MSTTRDGRASMSQSNDKTLMVLLAGYSSITAAVDAFDAAYGVYDERDTDGAGYCDAAVIDPRQTGPSSRVLRDTRPPGRRQAERAPAHREGLAARLVRYLGEGLALTG